MTNKGAPAGKAHTELVDGQEIVLFLFFWIKLYETDQPLTSLVRVVGLHIDALDEPLGDEPVFLQERLAARGFKLPDSAIHRQVVNRAVVGANTLDGLTQATIEDNLVEILPLGEIWGRCRRT